MLDVGWNGFYGSDGSEILGGYRVGSRGDPKKRQHAHAPCHVASTDAAAIPPYPPAETSYHPTARSTMSDEESYEYEYE